MSDSYVCSGATMKCTMGDQSAKLTVLPSRTVFLCGKPMANISDHTSMANLAPFGKCRSLAYPATASATAAAMGTLTPMPCVHNTPMPWMGGKTDYLIKGDPALLKSCKCQCIWGGMISITDDGQKGEGTQAVLQKSYQRKSVNKECAENTNNENLSETKKDQKNVIQSDSQGEKKTKLLEELKDFLTVEQGINENRKEQIIKELGGPQAAAKALASTPGISINENEIRQLTGYNLLEDYADNLIKKLGNATRNNAQGDGIKVDYTDNNGREMVIRLMNTGGGRTKPYFRISVKGPGSIAPDGKFSADQSLTHIQMKGDPTDQIIEIIRKNQKINKES